MCVCVCVCVDYTACVGFRGGSVVKSLLAKAGDARDMGLISGSGTSSGGGNGNPHQYSCLGNPTDRAAWQAAELDSV